MEYEAEHFAKDLKVASRPPWNLKESDIQISGGRLPFKDDGVGSVSESTVKNYIESQKGK